MGIGLTVNLKHLNAFANAVLLDEAMTVMHSIAACTNSNIIDLLERKTSYLHTRESGICHYLCEIGDYRHILVCLGAYGFFNPDTKNMANQMVTTAVAMELVHGKDYQIDGSMTALLFREQVHVTLFRLFSPDPVHGPF